LNLVSVESFVLLVNRMEQAIARVLVVSKRERRKQHTLDDLQDAQGDRQTSSTAIILSDLSVFLLFATYSRMDSRRSQHKEEFL